MNKKDKQDLMFAADYYLYKDLPNNFDKWSDKKLEIVCDIQKQSLLNLNLTALISAKQQ